MIPAPYNTKQILKSHIDVVNNASWNGSSADEVVTPDKTIPSNVVVVQVCTVLNEPYNLVTSRDISIRDLKVKISLIASIEPFYQRLLYKVHLLTDSYHLYDYCPTANFMKIYMTERIPGDMQIFMQHFQGHTLVMKFDRLDSIRSIKCMLAIRECIPVEEQRIFYEGRQLEDHRTLSDYNIPPNATMRVTLRLRGGGNDYDKRDNTKNYQINEVPNDGDIILYIPKITDDVDSSKL